MSQIDVLLQYASKTAALADTALASYIAKDLSGNPSGFNQSCVFDQQGAGLQVWNTSQDTTSTQTGPNGQTDTVTQHVYQPGYSLIASYADPAIAPGTADPNAASLGPFKASAACLLIADYDASAANPDAATNTGFIYYSAPSVAVSLAQWRFAPVPARPVPYPFGNA